MRGAGGIPVISLMRPPADDRRTRAGGRAPPHKGRRGLPTHRSRSRAGSGRVAQGQTLARVAGVWDAG
ncbi:MAG: hypothetical protein QXE96_00895 [Candidatus Caldarchaeum sp.]